MTAFTLDQVLSAMEEVVAEKGADYEYRSPLGSDACVYAYDGEEDIEPSCLIGCVYHRLGIPIELIHQLDGPVGDTLTDLAAHGYHFAADAVSAMKAAQEIQDKAVGDWPDGDYTWGAALSEAKGTAA